MHWPYTNNDHNVQLLYELNTAYYSSEYNYRMTLAPRILKNRTALGTPVGTGSARFHFSVVGLNCS